MLSLVDPGNSYLLGKKVWGKVYGFVFYEIGEMI